MKLNHDHSGCPTCGRKLSGKWIELHTPNGHFYALCSQQCADRLGDVLKSALVWTPQFHLQPVQVVNSVPNHLGEMAHDALAFVVDEAKPVTARLNRATEALEAVVRAWD